MIISKLGGLAMFLYGMTLLGSGLEKTSGGRLERTLEKLTDTVIKGVLLGALVTAAIQSSSATTVIVVGLVNARVLKLRNAIGVIMGANIGTTVTAHILRLSDLDSSNLFFPLSQADNACAVGLYCRYPFDYDGQTQQGPRYRLHFHWVRYPLYWYVYDGIVR